MCQRALQHKHANVKGGNKFVRNDPTMAFADMQNQPNSYEKTYVENIVS